MRKQLTLASIIVAIFLWSEAQAGGFYIHEQSARGLGRAFAGGAAEGGDAASLWFNPALSTDIERPTATGALSGIFISADLENEGTTLATPFSGGAPVPVAGGFGGTPIDSAAVPQAAFVYPIGRWRLGFNLNAPFGLVSAYDQGYFGRYDSLRTELLTLNAQLSLAYQVTPALSIGVGANGQYANAVLESAVPGVLPGAPDGFLQVVGDDLSPSFNLGVAYKPRPDLRVGASYRHTVSHRLTGSAKLLGLSGPLAAANFSTEVGAADLNLPGIGMLGVAYDLNDKLTLMAQGTYFNWSVFREIRVESPEAPELVTELNYKDTINAQAGIEYRLKPDWTLRAGFMFDPTPTRPGFRTTRVPDNTRYWGTLGASWSPQPHLSLDASVAFVSLREGVIDRSGTFFAGAPFASQQNLNASIDGNGFIASIGGSYRF